jgi:uncharacterized protein (DUF58 family)
MESSRVVLTPLGSSALGGGLVALLIGLLTLNLLLLVLPAAVIAFTAVEVLAFDRRTRGLRPEWFRWQRSENSAEVPIDGVGSMAIDVEIREPRAFYAEVFDPQPGSFEVVAGDPRLLTWWTGPGVVRLAYVYRPRERGTFRVGPTVVVAHDSFGLASRTTKLEDRWEVTVVPPLSVAEAAATRPYASQGPGELARRRPGRSSEFRSLREYDLADDAREIVWRRSTADRLYVRQHETEAHPEILVVLDTGRDGRLGMPGKEGLECGVLAAAMIAGEGLRRSESTGLLVFDDRPREYVPPSRGAETADRLTAALARARLAPVGFDPAGAIVEAVQRLRAPAAIVLVTTLPSPTAGLRPAVGALRAKGHALFLLAPEVRALYPAPGDALADRALAFALEPVRSAASRCAEVFREAGTEVAFYDPPIAPDHVGTLFERIALEAGGA